MRAFVNVFCYHRTSLRMNSGFEWDIISTSIMSGQPDSAINSIRNRFCNTNNTNLRIASCNIPKKTFKKTETVSETNTTCQLYTCCADVPPNPTPHDVQPDATNDPPPSEEYYRFVMGGCALALAIETSPDFQPADNSPECPGKKCMVLWEDE